MTASVRDALPVLDAARTLRDETSGLPGVSGVAYTYNPLVYAWEPHADYVRRYGHGKKRILFLGMNPGPFGMAQTGIPFGEIAAVRDWLGISGEVGRPDPENPARPVQGFECPRSEVSGRRLWGLFRDRFGSADQFFADHFVVNYCPLAFMDDGGRNLTPDKMSASETAKLFAACDRHLAAVAESTSAEWVVGVGAFAEDRARQALGRHSLRFGKILHPSPASPAANRGWAEAATKQLVAMGAWQ